MIVFDCLNDTTLLIWNLELESRIMKDFHIFFFMRNLFESFEKWIHSLRSDVIGWGGKDKNWIEPSGSHSGFCNQKVLPSSLFTSTMRFWHTTDFEVSEILQKIRQISTKTFYFPYKTFYFNYYTTAPPWLLQENKLRQILV